eukprot:156013-Amphidinium_carterae.1
MILLSQKNKNASVAGNGSVLQRTNVALEPISPFSSFVKCVSLSSGGVPLWTHGVIDHEPGDLGLHSMRVVRIAGDGNCQFASFSRLAWGNPHQHGYARGEVCVHLRDHPSLYQVLLSM